MNCQILLEHEADVDLTIDDGWTALHLAARYGDAEMVEVRYASLCWFTGTYCIDGQVLLEHGADVDSTPDDGWPPLHLAARYGDAEMVKVCYASLCWFTGKCFIDCQVLLEHEADVDSTTDNGWTVLHHAARYGDAEMVKVCYASLCWFTGKCFIDCQVLLEHEADVDSTTDNGWTALHHAARYGDAEMVEVRYASLCWFTGKCFIDGQVLLEHGAGVNAVKEDGWTALHIAARYGDAEMVKVR